LGREIKIPNSNIQKNFKPQTSNFKKASSLTLGMEQARFTQTLMRFSRNRVLRLEAFLRLEA
jgi:hypothetical protein